MTRPYSVKTLAERWGCSGRHVYDMIKQGKITPFRIGVHHIRIRAEEVERYECGLSGTGESGLPTRSVENASLYVQPTVRMPNDVSPTS